MINTKQGMIRKPLWGLWDNKTPLANPHKGWYLHYYDNGLGCYQDKLDRDDYLLDFPCFNHVYLRCGWCYLEPEEGKYNWELFDEVIRRWWKKDRRCSFRVCTKETGVDQAFATPTWVKDAGCRGEMINGTWEPDYGDPIFLEKFNNFMQALGARYDGAPFLEFVDVGSFGEWGECHTESTSNRTWPIEVMKEHIDMHTRAFRKTQVLLNYDMVALRRMYDGSEEELLDYAVKAGLGVRADSGCVSFYQERYGLSSMQIPGYFQPLTANGPCDLELGHYEPCQPYFNEGYTMLAACYEINVTFGGFHGYARDFLRDWPHFANEIGNVMGYWYFPQAVYVPESMRAGERVAFGMTWENRGTSKAYTKFDTWLKFTHKASGKIFWQACDQSDNTVWAPKGYTEELYSARLPKDAPAGEYTVAIGLFEPNNTDYKLPEGYENCADYPFPGRPIMIGLNQDLRDEHGCYRVSDITVGVYQDIPYEGVSVRPLLWPGFDKSELPG